MVASKRGFSPKHWNRIRSVPDATRDTFNSIRSWSLDTYITHHSWLSFWLVSHAYSRKDTSFRSGKRTACSRVVCHSYLHRHWPHSSANWIELIHEERSTLLTLSESIRSDYNTRRRNIIDPMSSDTERTPPFESWARLWRSEAFGWSIESQSGQTDFRSISDHFNRID